ncbi:MAG TPA: hypothetical protein ACFYDZ_08985, partial [Candidatus Brocadiaceae bacterium]
IRYINQNSRKMAMKNIRYEVPRKNNEVFLDPPLRCIPEMVFDNRKKIRGYRFEVNGVPFQILREKVRNDVLFHAVSYTRGIMSLLHDIPPTVYLQSCPGENTLKMQQEKGVIPGSFPYFSPTKDPVVIQTGHEPVLYHPGIWIKNHLVNHMVKTVGGIGINSIVDNDACNMGFAYTPVLSAQQSSVQKIELVKDMGKMAYEEIVFNDIGMIHQFKDEVFGLLGKNSSTMKGVTIESMQTTFRRFTDCIVGCYHKGCKDMVGLLTSVRKLLEEEFRIDNLELPVSWMCDGDGFCHFLLHIVYNAKRFAEIYNRKLAEYRYMHKIRSKANPLPDLKIAGDLIELPFWVWKAGEPRGKCYGIEAGDLIRVTNGHDVVFSLKKGDGVSDHIAQLKALKDIRIKIRPRAITTTMFFRLFLCDVFIHGIGGAKYDTITDEIMREFFEVEPPAFITISATLFLPLDAYAVDKKTREEMQKSMHDMHYNPERYASEEVRNDTVFCEKARTKQMLLQKMAHCDTKEKGNCFRQVKELNTLLLDQISGEFREKQKEFNRINAMLAYNKVVEFREYPLCIYPSEFLKNFYRNVFSRQFSRQ